MSGYISYLYIAGIAFAGSVVLIIIRMLIVSIERKRQSRLKTLTDIEAVPTESPDKDDDAEFRKRGKERIRVRFTITRVFLYVSLTLLATTLIVLPFIGTIPATVVSLFVAILTVLIGIASRPFLENFVAGISISLSNLVRIGDVVDIDGNYGTIEDITMTHTVVRRWDWIRYTVPNGVMIQKAFKNYTVCDSNRWVYVEFHVDLDSDLDLVQEIAERAPQHSRFFNDVEPPQFWIVELEKESAKCMVVAWVTSPADGWMLSVDIRRSLIERFQEHGIESHTYHYRPRTMTQPQRESNGDG